MITGVLRNFATLPGKHLCQDSGQQPETWHRCFPVNFSKFLGTLFTEHLQTTTSGCRYSGLQL